MSDDKTIQKNIRRTVVYCLIFITVVVALMLNKFTTKQPLTSQQISQLGGLMFERPRQLKPFELIDHNQQVFNNNRFIGTWSLVFFGFTHCPDVCPTTLAELAKTAKLSKQLEQWRDIQVILVTVDPERDSTDKLKQYVPFFDPDFIGVTGEFGVIAEFATGLTSAFAKIPSNGPDGYTVEHSANISIINPNGHYAGFLRSPHKAENMAQIVDYLVSK